MVVDLPNIQELVELSSNDEPMEEYRKEDPELGEPQAVQGIEDAELGVSNSSFDSGEGPEDNLI